MAMKARRPHALKLLLVKSGKRQQDLAMAIGVSEPQLSRWLNCLRPLPPDMADRIKAEIER